MSGQPVRRAKRGLRIAAYITVGTAIASGLSAPCRPKSRSRRRRRRCRPSPSALRRKQPRAQRAHQTNARSVAPPDLSRGPAGARRRDADDRLSSSLGSHFGTRYRRRQSSILRLLFGSTIGGGPAAPDKLSARRGLTQTGTRRPRLALAMPPLNLGSAGPPGDLGPARTLTVRPDCPCLPWCCLLSIRRLGICVAVEIAIKPVDLPIQALDEMLGFARAREVVVLAREQDQF